MGPFGLYSTVEFPRSEGAPEALGSDAWVYLELSVVWA